MAVKWICQNVTIYVTKNIKFLASTISSSNKSFESIENIDGCVWWSVPRGYKKWLRIWFANFDASVFKDIGHKVIMKFVNNIITYV